MARRRGARLVIATTLLARAALAEPPASASTAPTATPEPATTTAVEAATPAAPPIEPGAEAVTRLVLAWPVAPLSFSYSEARPVVPLQWDGAPTTFRAEAVWVQEGAFSLRSITAAEQKLELDCRITCRPMVEHSATIEARLSLGSPGKAVPETHVFARGKAASTTGEGFTSPRTNALLHLGFGGQLDL
jgi:hypothetical protein